MGAQHQQMHRKVLLRRQLARILGDPTRTPGVAWLPFCGDGDLAAACWNDRQIIAADLDPKRVANAQAALPDAVVTTGDCDTWPLDGPLTDVAVADLDAYSYPYHAWRALKANATLADRALILFTDGQLQTIKRHGIWTEPQGGDHVYALDDDGNIDTNAMRRVLSRWWRGHIAPWWRVELADIGYRQLACRFYQRGALMLYWGAVIVRKA